MRLEDYLPTRTFELVVHTADLGAGARRAARRTGDGGRPGAGHHRDIALTDGTAGSLLLLATGRTGLPERFSVM
jgi:hypothetical protein